MNAYIYNADIYCEDCGKAIRRRIRKEGFAPEFPQDETTYDSDEYPKGPYDDGGGEADCPQHCGAGAKCLNALELNGQRYGAFLENPLTSHGEDYVKELHREEPTDITEMWMSHYGLAGYDDTEECQYDDEIASHEERLAAGDYGEYRDE